MGLDLTLLPFERQYREDDAYAHTLLDMERNRYLFSKIQELEADSGQIVPRRFDTYLCRDDAYEEPHYGNTQETPYGEPLRWVTVAALEQLLTREADPHLNDDKSRAAYAYLTALPMTTKVALYWS